MTWCIKNWTAIKTHAARLAMTAGGILILHREIYEVQTPEPLLVFLGLWLVGIPPAQFFDGLRRIGQAAESAMTQETPKQEDNEPDNLKREERDDA